jgi:hypothetical protein
MRAILGAIPLVFILTAAACGDSDPVAEDANNSVELSTVVAEADATANAVRNEAEETPPSPASDPATTPALPTPGGIIPAQYQGRWGMVPADCTSTRGDAKGLMTIGDTSIRFHESTATLTSQRPAIATSFAGLFAFRGEGQSWEKVITFTRMGDTLKRAEPEGSFTYKRCA